MDLKDPLAPIHRLFKLIQKIRQRVKEREWFFQDERIDRQDPEQHHRDRAKPGDHPLQAVIAIAPLEKEIDEKNDEEKNDDDENKHLRVLLSILAGIMQSKLRQVLNQ
jgi:hypothetical protein